MHRNRRGAVSFTVVATGTPPLNYQWRKDGQPLTGQTSATLTLVNAPRPGKVRLGDVDSSSGQLPFRGGSRRDTAERLKPLARLPRPAALAGLTGC
jgi:hypothetical protein